MFICCYSIQHRSFKILGNIINNSSNQGNILIITDKVDVYEYFSSKRIKCILYEIRGLIFDKFINTAPNVSSEEFFVLSKVKKKIDFTDMIFDKFLPKVVFTTCDLHIYERVFTQEGINRGVVTVTHQHGQMSPNNNILKYTISDYLVAWGVGTKNNFKNIFERTKIKVFGTDIYTELINEKNKHGKEYITIALNPRSDEINKYLISQVCKQINKINVADLMKYKLILKLHPEMKLKFWKKVFFETVKQNKLKIKFDCFSGNNHIIINKTKILVVLSSSITLEAFMCDVPVVALDIPQIYNNPFVYFKRLEGSIVNIENLSEKIEKILTDREYSRDFIYKQRLALNHEVSYFDSSVRELKWVNNFVK